MRAIGIRRRQALHIGVRINVIWVALFLGSFASASPAIASDDPAFLGVDWVISEAEMPVESVWVKEQKAVLETRLWPTALYITPTEVVDARQRPLLPAGAQLVRMSIAPPSPLTVACNLHKTDDRSFLSGRKHVCLVDTENDGQFDSWFDEGLSSSWWFALERSDIPRLEQTSSVSLIEVDPQAFRGPPALRLHYQRIMDVGNLGQRIFNGEGLPTRSRMSEDRVRFHYEAGSGRSLKRFGDMCNEAELTHLCADALFPSEAMVGGLGLSILERRKEDLLIRVNENFQPLVIRFTSLDYDSYSTTGDYMIIEMAEQGD